METATALIFCWYNAEWQQTEKKKKAAGQGRNGGVQKRKRKERTGKENDRKLGIHHAFEDATSQQF